jgi:DNA-binding SARP family transcriptional activator/TolB-like protein
LNRLYLLGSVRLEPFSAAPRRSVLSQPRRVALLAYLALRARQGPQRRDSLLAVFWPESDTDHARGSLRNALHYLRVSLGSEVIRSHGSEEVQLDPAALWCDAVEFDARCAAGDLDAALRLYAGDLLDGFFVSEAPEFEAWLEAERSRLRHLATEAARTLARHAEAAGEPGLALHRLRRLHELAPTDEAAARDLMRILAAGTDRGAALGVYTELETRLERDFGLEPSPETRQLADAIRSAPAGGGAAPATEAPSAPAPTPGGAARAGRPGSGRAWLRPLPRRLLFGMLAGLAVAAAGVLVRAARSAVPSADLVAVLPFEYRGAPAHAYLAEGLADLLAANLHGAGELRAVDPRALPGWGAPAGRLETEHGRRAAAAHGAGLFVLGSVTEAAGQLRVSAALYGPAVPSAQAGRAGRTAVVAHGDVDDVLSLVDRLSMGLLEGRGGTTLGRAALRTTTSVEALKAFLSGEAALRGGRLHDALESFRRATEHDTTFALAHYRVSSIAYRQGVARIPLQHAAAGLRHAARVPREDSLLLAAWHQHVTGSLLDAHRLYEEALVLQPSHVEAAFQLGELRFHWGSAIGVPASEAREPFSRVLLAPPNDVEAALHLARLAGRDGRHGELDSLAASVRRGGLDSRAMTEIEALRAFLTGDGASQAGALAAALAAGHRPLTLLEALAAYSYNLRDVERAAQERLPRESAPDEHARLQLFLVQLQLGLGRIRDAARSTEAAALPEARRVEYRAMIAALPFVPLDLGEAASVRVDLAAHPDLPLRAQGGPFAGPGIEYPHLLWPGMFRPRRLLLLGALHLRLADRAGAAAAADSLAALAPVEELAGHYERILRARLAAAGGAPQAALAVLGPPRLTSIRTFESLVDHDRPYERWLRGELLRETGRAAEALRWYGTFPDPAARDLAYLAPSHLRRAQLHEAAGDRRLASFHYERFVDLWRDADPELQPEVARARARLHALAPRS